ncbi:MAG: alanine--glyoxylate aminotransferase family protein, partial [Firmicutes bacterium]|nr:alanine--glyoxylate aminotransferase family protein [Bacillota bacterium]
FERHSLLARAVRAAVRALGLELLAPEEHASHTVTAVLGPEGLPVEELRRVLYSRYGVVVAGGQGILRGKIFRIAHMGFVDRTDILAVLAALEMAMAELKYPVALGSGVRAAQEVFLGRGAS